MACILGFSGSQSDRLRCPMLFRALLLTLLLSSAAASDCQAGTYVDTADDACAKCAEDTYSEEVNTTSCTRCPQNAGTAGKLAGTSTKMCGCNLGFFHPNSTLYTGASPCEPCLPNADCSGSTAPPLCQRPELWILEDDKSTGPAGERSYYRKMDPTKKWRGSVDDLPNKGAEVRKKSDNSLVRPGFTGIFIDFSLGKSALEFKCTKNPAVSSRATVLACCYR